MTRLTVHIDLTADLDADTGSDGAAMILAATLAYCARVENFHLFRAMMGEVAARYPAGPDRVEMTEWAATLSPHVLDALRAGMRAGLPS